MGSILYTVILMENCCNIGVPTSTSASFSTKTGKSAVNRLTEISNILVVAGGRRKVGMAAVGLLGEKRA